MPCPNTYLWYTVPHTLLHLFQFEASVEELRVIAGILVVCSSGKMLENAIGLLRIRILRGVDLAVRDFNSSDPYVVVRSGKQKLKTRVIKKSLDPEWNEDLTLCVTDPNQPVKLFVYDWDMLSFDDKMGDAEIDIRPFVETINLNVEGLADGTVIGKVKPTRQNCLSEESRIVWVGGKIVQNLFLRLQNVERGEVEVQLHWIDIPN